MLLNFMSTILFPKKFNNKRGKEKNGKKYLKNIAQPEKFSLFRPMKNFTEFSFTGRLQV